MPNPKIEISNPLPGQWPWLRLERAEALVRRQKARRLTDGRLFLFHIQSDADARARAEQERITGELSVRDGMATRQQRRGLGICGDPDSMIRAGSAGEGAWYWQHSVYRNK